MPPLDTMNLTSSPIQANSDHSKAKRVRPSPESKKTISKRKVSFNERVKVRKTRHLNNFKDDEIQAYWFNPEEFDAIKRNLLSEILYFNTLRTVYSDNEAVASSEHRCLRGIECRLDGAYELRQRQRSLALNIVLSEQERQQESGNPDDELIADLYSQIVCLDASRARSRGLQDELFVLS